VYQERSRKKVFSCNDCHSTFSPFTGTIFEHSSTDLRKWFYAIHLFLNGKKGISGLQLQREIGVTYKTAWRMLQQIRMAMGNANQKEFFDTIVEIDETYVGGKPRKDNEHDDNLPKGSGAKRGRGTSKTPVVGVIDRNNKKVYAKIAMPDENGKKLTAKQLMDVLNTVSKQENGNVVITDEYLGYSPLTANKFIHLRIDHTKAFSDHKGVHTNNIESFWATLKSELVNHQHYKTREEAWQSIFEYIEVFYNRKRLHSSLGYLSPEAFEAGLN
jgi:transposase-like protein